MLLLESSLDVATNKLAKKLFERFKDVVEMGYVHVPRSYVLVDRAPVDIESLGVAGKKLSAASKGLYVTLKAYLQMIDQQDVNDAQAENFSKNKIALDFSASVLRSMTKEEPIDIELRVFIYVDSDWYVDVMMSGGTLKPRLKKQYSDVYMGINRVLRHELEHVSQSIDVLKTIPKKTKMKQVKMTPARYVKYYLSQGEIEAFVSETYHQAKKKKRPMSELMELRLKTIKDNAIEDGMSLKRADAFIDALRDAWSSYAKKRFPKAV